MPASYDMSPDQHRAAAPSKSVYRSNSRSEFIPDYEVIPADKNGVRKDAASSREIMMSETGSVKSAKSGSSDGDKKKEKVPMVGMAETFRYSNGGERVLIILGILFACAHGAAMPITVIIFGDMTDSFINSGALEDHINTYIANWTQACLSAGYNWCGNLTTDYLLQEPARIFWVCQELGQPPGCEMAQNLTNPAEPVQGLLDQVTEYSIYFVIIGCCVQVVGYAQVVCWQTAAFNQSQRIRLLLFQSIMKQEIGWFDTHEVGELNNRMTDDVMKIEGGIGEKLGLFFQYTATFVAGIIIGFVHSWELTLVILSVSPLLVLSGMAMGKVGASMTSKELLSYAKAGAVAEEVFGGIRTVMAFGGEAKECKRYDQNLLDARAFGVKKGMAQGITMGLIFFIMFGAYALGFWYGSKLVFEEKVSPGDLLTVFFSVLIGTFSIGTAAPNLQDFAQARGAAHVIYAIIENKPSIDSSSPAGSTPDNIVGNMEFRNIHFNYPSRLDVKVLQGLSLRINVGQTVALVGSSGCGKSTTVQLLQRFYDPEIGEVTMDGIDIREFNVKWLRQKIGVVSQEPVLFATTIEENIKYGQEGASTEDVIQACKEANAHEFISKLPKKYDTLVGERGAQLSGGQKQRIAIARALVRNPKILLLDEATSALDTESEATVQAALDTARMGRTTLVIAHRLSTIRTADVIVGVKDGKAVEQGTHEELMSRKGLYHELVMNQQSHFEVDGEEIDDGLPKKPDLDRGVSVRTSYKLKRGMSTMSAGSDLQRMTSVKGEDDEAEEELPDPQMKRVMRMNAPEWGLILGGCICATAVGCVQPMFAIVFATILGFFSDDDVQEKINLWSGMFAVIGLGAGLGMLGMNSLFSRSGEFLTMRLRQLSFQTVLKQDMAFFDDHSNNVGALCTRLATDASAVQGATGVRLGMFCQSIASIGAGIVIGFIYSWELTLLIIGFSPFLLGSGFVQMKVMSGNQVSNKLALERAGKIAIEAIENIRTVATLTKEDKFLKEYEQETLPPFITNKKKAHIQGVAFGFSQAIMFMANAACFSLGAYLVENRGLAYEDMFKVFMALVFGAVSAGQASSFAPDYSKAKVSASKIFQLIDREPSIDSSDPSGKKLGGCQGTIKLRNVQFNYPTRPNVPVLQGLDLDVNPGQTVALVGSSGCGKSTTVQLLERFYDPAQGQVSVEGENLRELNVQWARSQMGIVSQEPILFDCSIRENIAYGDNSREVSINEIIQAAKNANIHSFIESLPQGYDTNVGDKGAQLSGGQKQRVAIARALVRNPKILLLDEATSALDTESEKVVQAALDRAQEGRTCIVIAHRLSTIQNADCIVVIHQGKAVEMGTHSELLQKRGRYYKLNNAQLRKD